MHGEKGNVAFELAFSLDILEKSDEPWAHLVGSFYDSTGNVICDEIRKNVSNFYSTYMDNEDLEIDAIYKSIGDYVTKM